MPCIIDTLVHACARVPSSHKSYSIEPGGAQASRLQRRTVRGRDCTAVTRSRARARARLRITHYTLRVGVSRWCTEQRSAAYVGGTFPLPLLYAYAFGAFSLLSHSPHYSLSHKKRKEAKMPRVFALAFAFALLD